MKILVTLPWMPYPASDGGKQGSLNMLVETQHAADVVLVFPIFTKGQLQHLDTLKGMLPKVKIRPFAYYDDKGRSVRCFSSTALTGFLSRDGSNSLS